MRIHFCAQCGIPKSDKNLHSCNNSCVDIGMKNETTAILLFRFYLQSSKQETLPVQVAFCAESGTKGSNPTDSFFNLVIKLVSYQQTKGRLDGEACGAHTS